MKISMWGKHRHILGRDTLGRHILGRLPLACILLLLLTLGVGLNAMPPQPGQPGQPGVSKVLVALQPRAQDPADDRSHPPHRATTPGKGILLVASHQLRDPRFAQTVILLTNYSPKGATGFIINRPTNVPIAIAMPAITALQNRSELLMIGGPVAMNSLHLLLRSARPLPGKYNKVMDKIYHAHDAHMMDEILARPITENTLRFLAGYSGWSPGQLDREIIRGDWHLINADANTVFDTPADEIWQLLDRLTSGVWTLASM